MLVKYSKLHLKHRSKKQISKDILLVILGSSLLFIAGSAIWAATLEMPALDNFESRAIANSTKIYDRTGKTILYNIGDNIKRTVISGSEMNPFIGKATISIEDAHFYEHYGFRPTSVIRAMLANAQSGGYSQGGSTITQQVVKNALLTREKTVTRKIKEIILSLRLDHSVPKDKILEMYLNESPYGGTIYGVEEASITYFGKHASEINLTEAAYLAAIPQRPTYYNPYGKNRNELEKRKNLVLERMFELGHITQAEKDSSQKVFVEFKKKTDANGKALHFIMDLREQLEITYGKETVNTGGLKVITTIDANLQTKFEEIVKDGALANEKKYKASNAALVAIDPKTGQILSMVGSRDFQDTEIPGQFNVATALRQPGSSFKPIVYAQALAEGFTPETTLFDLPTNFSTACDAWGNPFEGRASSSCYMPVNYDGKFRGPISIRDALAQSLNIPAVKLLYLVGIKDAITLAQNLGLSSISGDRYGLTLVLGGGEVRLLDMVGAYGAFANKGEFNKPYGIIEVRDIDGNILEKNNPEPKRVLPESVTTLLTSILSDNNARTPAYGYNSPLYFGERPVAVKTGTTNDYKDVWTIGYTPSIAIGMWAGNNDNRSIDKRVAGAVIAPVWHKAMEAATKDTPIEYFDQPAPNETDKDILRGTWCGSEGLHTILHFTTRGNPSGPNPSNPRDDSQYDLWDQPIQKWANENSACGHTNASTSIVSTSTISTNTNIFLIPPTILNNPQ